jgi:hypothetical protein
MEHFGKTLMLRRTSNIQTNKKLKIADFYVHTSWGHAQNIGSFIILLSL